MARLHLAGEPLTETDKGGGASRQHADDEDRRRHIEELVLHVDGKAEAEESEGRQYRGREQNRRDKLELFGGHLMPVAVAVEVVELPADPEIAGKGVAVLIELALRPRGIDQFEGPQAVLHPSELARLLDRVGLGYRFDPAFNDNLRGRTIGILGYTVVFGLTCLPLGRAFKADARSTEPTSG